MKILGFLFQASKGVIMGAGFGFTVMLTVLSLSVKNGATVAKVDLSTLTSGYLVYLWTISLLIFFVGTIASTAIKAVAMYKMKRKETKE